MDHKVNQDHIMDAEILNIQKKVTVQEDGFVILCFSLENTGSKTWEPKNIFLVCKEGMFKNEKFELNQNVEKDQEYKFNLKKKVKQMKEQTEQLTFQLCKLEGGNEKYFG